ncbi:MAG TPA: DUF2336 domain-containing protein [Bradyrhizobium sp.]|nr:DUF2336 domain-containing protein [Bradyrhizobium sp.]
MTEASQFSLKELNEAISRGSPESREQALWHATNILIEGRYTEDQIWVFGEVIGRLAEEIEHAARTKLAKRLAHTNNAPFKVIKALAFDDSIDVAGSVLQFSQRLDTKSLVANVRTKSQPHLLAISKRNSIPAEVTDELVTRGNQEVVQTVASNDGACFSDFGFLQMIKRSETDSILAEHIGLRKEIPRHMFQQLIAKASDDVKRKLERERPDLAVEIHSSVTEVAGHLHSKFGPATKSYFAAKRAVTGLHQYGRLNEKSIAEYALAHKLEEVIVGLSLLCSLPVDVVERTLVHDNREMTLVLAKELGFAWDTTMALLFLGAKNHRIPAGDLDNLRDEFARLDAATSRSVLRTYQSRKQAGAADSDDRRLPQLHSA